MMHSRDKLRSLIDFKKCGYMIVGEAKSGREAIGLIEKLKPDVIITDIVMQNINGIELIEFIQKNYPDVVELLSVLMMITVMSVMSLNSSKGLFA